MSITKKELFKLCDENNDAINELRLQSDSTDFVLATLIQQLKDGGIISELGAEPQPQLKQLDQSIFEGLDEKWRFAAVDKCGEVWVCTAETKPSRDGVFLPTNNQDTLFIGHSYYDLNWQNSLIERDIAKELTGSDLARAMLARGDKCVLIRMGVRDDKQAKEIGRFAIATSIDESGRFNVMSDQQPISKVDFAVPINNQGEPLTASEVGL